MLPSVTTLLKVEEVYGGIDHEIEGIGEKLNKRGILEEQELGLKIRDCLLFEEGKENSGQILPSGNEDFNNKTQLENVAALGTSNSLNGDTQFTDYSNPQSADASDLSQFPLVFTGALFVVINKPPSVNMLGLLQGFAAGLMLSITFFNLAPNAINSIGFLKGNVWFYVGVVFFAAVANFIPEPVNAPVSVGDKDIKRQVLFSGTITAIGMTLHNFPEGMTLFLGSIKDPHYRHSCTSLSQGFRVGLNLALAIALHNIPEGVAVALPVYFATESKWQAFKLATLYGLAEPLAVIIVAYIFPSNLSPEILEGLLASVGGVMAFLTLHEMLPQAFGYAGHNQAVKAVFFGMAFMSAR
ncbi:hypothetical protein RD792_003854 [Penstemon davidsonii]|uniref:Uncharacterized protein n=1 Tax=Penstemon davidsonii TaxID=160366 RepID=A0ABR0DFU5_9LAMI|nr:hypothetical protein RD792_003854 [Penstemon davidsonii]